MKPVPTLLHLVIAAFLAGCANEHDGLEQAFHPADDFGPSLARMGYDDPQLPELAPGPPPGAESDATSDPAAGDDDAIAAAVPVPARLAAAPNPFNPVTELRFALPKGGARVILAVHGVDGREVARLLDAHLPEGEHRRVWRGQDGRGRKVPSGVYFVLLHAGEEVVVRKVVVVK